MNQLYNANANKIIDKIWLGNQKSALDRDFFERNNIKAVLNCTPDVPNKFAPNNVEYMRLTLDDSLQKKDIDKMLRYFPPALSFIHKNLHLENKNILIHCHAGMQRSAAVLVAFLMYHKRMTLSNAKNLVVSKRPIAFLGGNYVNFLPALIEFQKMI